VGIADDMWGCHRDVQLWMNMWGCMGTGHGSGNCTGENAGHVRNAQPWMMVWEDLGQKHRDEGVVCADENTGYAQPWNKAQDAWGMAHSGQRQGCTRAHGRGKGAGEG